MGTKTQKSAVLHHMRTRGPLTVMTAFSRLGVTRLSERCAELERDGHPINRAWTKRNDKRLVEYSLARRKRKAA